MVRVVSSPISKIRRVGPGKTVVITGSQSFVQPYEELDRPIAHRDHIEATRTIAFLMLTDSWELRRPGPRFYGDPFGWPED
jgi:hypothetical protein